MRSSLFCSSMKTATALWLLGLLSAGVVRAQDPTCVNYQDYIHLQSWLYKAELPGTPLDMVSSGNYLYVVSGTALYVLDVSDKIHPQPIGSVEVSALEVDLSWRADMVVVAGYYAVSTIDVSDPTNPCVLGSCPISYSSAHLAMAENCALVSYTDGINIYEIDYANLGQITPISHVATSTVMGIETKDGYAYVLGYGITILNIADPHNPVIVGGVNESAWYKDLSFSGNLAFVADYAYGIHAYDMSDPELPVFLGAGDETFRGSDIAVVDGKAYVIGTTGQYNGAGMAVYDVSHPASPTHIGRVYSECNYALCATTSFAFLGGYDGFQIFNTANCTQPGPFQVPEFDLGEVAAMIIKDGRAYIYSTVYLYIYEWDGESRPRLLSTYHLGTYYIRGLAVENDLVFLANGYNGVTILDVSDARNPEACAIVDTPGYAQDVIPCGNVGYVVDGSTGLQIINFENPDVIEIVGTVALGYTQAAALSNGYLYVAASYGGLKILDIADPLNPVMVGAVAGFCAEDLALEGSRAAVLDSQYEGIVVFVDIAHASAPVVTSTLAMPHMEDLELVGGYVYAGCFGYGVNVIDGRNPTDPYIAGTIYSGMSVEHLFKLDDCLLTGNYLRKVPFQCAGATPVLHRDELLKATAILQTAPNPFNPRTTITFSVGSPGRVVATVFSLAGRKVATLADGTFSAGAHQVEWQGRDDKGRPMPSGTYFVQVATGENRDTRKISLVR